MRLSQGSRSSFCSARPPSLAPRPRPPYFVVVGSEVFRYESYWNGQFWPQILGSIVSSVTSTILTKGCRASCLRSKMFVRSASRSTVTPATPTRASTARSQPRCRPPGDPTLAMCSLVSAPGAVSGRGVAVETIEAAACTAAPFDHGVDETFVAPQAVLANEVAVSGSDLDGLLEILQGEGGRVAKAVLGLGHPLREARVGQAALDAGRGMPVATFEPGVVLRIHDATVRARSWIRREVGEAFRVDEGEGSDAEGDSEQAGEEDPEARPRHGRRSNASARGVTRTSCSRRLWADRRRSGPLGYAFARHVAGAVHANGQELEPAPGRAGQQHEEDQPYESHAQAGEEHRDGRPSQPPAHSKATMTGPQAVSKMLPRA